MIVKTATLIMSLLLFGCSNNSEPSLPLDEPTSQEDPASQEEPTSQEDPASQEEPTSQDDPTSQEDPTSQDEPASQEQFLANNAASDSVTVTESGLQYEVLRAATGPMPSADSVITVHYTGELFDGTEIDSSYIRGEPATFVLSGAIDGWVEGVQLMSVGSQYRFVIPAHLAYGNRGAGELIGPGAALIFEVELLEVNSM